MPVADLTIGNDFGRDPGRGRFRGRTLLSLVACWLLLNTSNTQAEDSVTLVVRMAGANPATGQFVLSLFDSAENFLRSPLLEKTVAVTADGSASLQLGNLASGRYAASVFHDADNDGELNTGLFGIPREPVGFSNNARSSFGPPSFEDAAVVVQSGTVLLIRVAGVND